MSPDLSPPHLRPATEGDARLLWDWVNDPLVRASAFRSDVIVWDDHVRWLRAKLASPECRIYVAEDRGVPVAQVRFELDGKGGAEISVSVAAEVRGSGIGSAVVGAGCARVFGETGVHRVLARVRLENSASQRLFAGAGFDDRGSTAVCRRYVLPHPASEQGFVLATRRRLRDVFDRQLKCLPGIWTLVTDPAELTTDRLGALAPRYVFFLHWPSSVPSAITDTFTCIDFRMSDPRFGPVELAAPLIRRIIADEAAPAESMLVRAV